MGCVIKELGEAHEVYIGIVAVKVYSIPEEKLVEVLIKEVRAMLHG